MIKPITEWTLGEVIAECGRHKECGQSCQLYTGFTCLACQITGNSPDEWAKNNPLK